MSASSPSSEDRDDFAARADGEALGAVTPVTGLSMDAEPSAAAKAQPAPGSGGLSAATGCLSPPPATDAATVPPMNLLAHIDKLKAEQKRLKDEKKALSKTLKNAEKRRARLKKKARQLTNKDLQDVLELRESELAASQSSVPPPAADVQKQAAETGA